VERKIRVGSVSYLNAKPLLYGFEQGAMKDQIELITEFPSKIATMLVEDKIDIGLVPVAIIPRLKEWHINTNYCIGCDRPVASVCIFSEVPIHEIKEVLLDYQSRTSVRLARILLREFWNVDPILTDAKEDFREHISGSTAGVVIGDRALEQRKTSKYIYDLGEAWIQMTGLPFVFAAWISNKQLDPAFIEEFNKANALGLEQLDQVVAEHPYTIFDLKEYYTEHISYNLTEEKKRGLALFLDKLPSYM
jgi:chorismate dehydratase